MLKRCLPHAPLRMRLSVFISWLAGLSNSALAAGEG